MDWPDKGWSRSRSDERPSRKGWVAGREAAVFGNVVCEACPAAGVRRTASARGDPGRASCGASPGPGTSEVCVWAVMMVTEALGAEAHPPEAGRWVVGCRGEWNTPPLSCRDGPGVGAVRPS